MKMAGYYVETYGSNKDYERFLNFYLMENASNFPEDLDSHISTSKIL